MLKCTTKTVISVDCYDLEDYINGHYDHPIELIASWEQGNDSVFEVHINGEEPSVWEAQELAEFKQNGGGGYGVPQIVMNEMVRDGLLEAGDYLVDICW